MCTSSISNMICHKFSRGAAFYTLNGKNVNVMLELNLLHITRLRTAIEFSGLIELRISYVFQP